MKNLLTATLPALALLALGGCATSGALTSTTESDGVYYSSADKTTATSNLNSVYSNRGYNQSVAGSANPDGFAYNRATDVAGNAAPVTGTPAATTDDANPDYVAGAGTTTEGYNTSTLGGSSDYYASSLNSNGSGFGVPYTGPGVSTYNYSPAVSSYSSFYGSPFSYGLGLGYGAFGGGFGYPYGGLYSPYAYSGFYDPYYSSFYSPFYSPFGFYGSGLSLGFGYGFGGFGGYGYPFGGYYGGYSPYYGGGYGGYGYRSYGSAASGVYSDGRSGVVVGPRGSRGGMVLNSRANSAMGTAGANVPVNVGAGRRGGGMVMGANGMAAPAPTMNGMSQLNTGRGAFSNGAMGQPSVATPGGVPAGAVANPSGGRRGGFFSGFFGNGAAGVQRAQMAQPQSNGGYAPQQRQFGNQQANRGFSQPNRSFSQPSRSFSQPSFSQPSRSFSAPSGGGGFGGGGGGGFGGGGGRRGGR